MDLLKYARFFTTIVEEGHFGEAARRLGMTQPPISQGLKRLEAELGVRLLDRGPTGVSLTPAGQALLPPVRRLLAAEADLRGQARRQAAPSDGLRLGVVEQLPTRWVVALVNHSAEHIDGGVDLQTAPTVTLVNELAAGRLDLAIVVHPTVLGDLVGSQVVRLPSWLLVPPEDVSDGESGHRLRDMVRRPVAVPPRAHAPAAHDLLIDTLLEHGVTHPTVTVEDERAALALVATGQACTLAFDMPPPHGVAAIALPTDLLPLRLRVVWADRSPGRDLADRGHDLANLLARAGHPEHA